MRERNEVKIMMDGRIYICSGREHEDKYCTKCRLRYMCLTNLEFGLTPDLNNEFRKSNDLAKFLFEGHNMSVKLEPTNVEDH